MVGDFRASAVKLGNEVFVVFFIMGPFLFSLTWMLEIMGLKGGSVGVAT